MIINKYLNRVKRSNNSRKGFVRKTKKWNNSGLKEYPLNNQVGSPFPKNRIKKNVAFKECKTESSLGNPCKTTLNSTEDLGRI